MRSSRLHNRFNGNRSKRARGFSLIEVMMASIDARTNIQKWTPDPSSATRGTAFVEVDWLQTGGAGESAGPQHLLRYFMVYVTNIDATSKIVDCTAVLGGSGDGQIWHRNSGDPTKIYYDEGNVGIGTTTPQTKMDVAGGVKIGNEATCNAAHAGTIRWTGAVFEGCDGTAWAPFGGSGSCPAGMVSAGSYCIDMNERAPLSWWNAATACRTAGFQLCTTAQWHPACVAGLALNMTDNLEWAGDMAYHVSQYHAVVIGNGSCTSGTVQPPAADVHGFRCCKHK